MMYVHAPTVTKTCMCACIFYYVVHQVACPSLSLSLSPSLDPSLAVLAMCVGSDVATLGTLVIVYVCVRASEMLLFDWTIVSRRRSVRTN